MRDGYVPTVSIVNLGTEAFAQFSDISPQHFILVGKQAFTETDFDFVLKRTWHGARHKSQSFLQFLLTELQLNYKVLGITFAVSACLMFLARDLSLYDLASSMLIQTATVFLSIYLIFTVSQNQILYSDRKLFEEGVLQKYYSDDRNLTLLALVTIFATLMNAVLSHLLPNLFKDPLKLSDTIAIIVDHHVFVSIAFAISITLLLDTFLSVANYYLKRSRDVLEREIVADILHDDFRDKVKDSSEK